MQSSSQPTAPPVAAALPPGEVAVRISMLAPVVFGPAVVERFMAPAVPGLATLAAVPSLCFLLEHPSGRKLVWDLGIRKDYARYAPVVASYIPTTGYTIDVSQDVAEMLQAQGVALAEVEAVIWSHWHWDHIGDPSTFPETTKLVVGRGFKQAMLPGSPANPDSPILESDYANRELEEITFDGPLSSRIGQFRAHDYFGDGSFYLLDSPGHAVGHLCGLVRTTTTTTTTTSQPATFVLLGSDTCHYAGVLRPSPQQPLPPLPDKTPAWAALQAARGRRPTDPLFDGTFALDPAVARQTVRWLQELDCRDDVFVILAHDVHVHATAPRYPQALNDWRARDLGNRLKWAFLRDLEPYWKANGLA